MINWTALDQHLVAQYKSIPTSYQWLYLQTLATATDRRRWLESLPLQPRAEVLDVGTGPGMIALELATLGCEVIGLDRDAEVLTVARTLADGLGHPNLPFHEGDVMTLPPHRWSADGIFSRFVFQYLPHPEEALRRLKENLKPGGFLALEDIDDGYMIEFPQSPPAWQKVIDAFRAHQHLLGGDRYIGRKLAHLAEQAGYQVEDLALSVMSQQASLTADDLSLQFEILRVSQVLPEMLTEGLLTESAWVQGRAALLEELPITRYVSNGTVRLVARSLPR